MSNGTINRRISDMSEDIQNTVIFLVQQSKMFTIQVDKSTDISGKAKLIAFIRFVNNEKISEQFFCCKELKERLVKIFLIDLCHLEKRLIVQSY